MGEVIERLGLKHRADHPAGALSHGEKRQVEVAMAMAGDPQLLLLAEPMAGAGPSASKDLANLFISLKGRAAVLLVEHDVDLVFSIADRICVLVAGEVIALGPPEQIRNDPGVREAYLGEEVASGR